VVLVDLAAEDRAQIIMELQHGIQQSPLQMAQVVVVVEEEELEMLAQLEMAVLE
jgi:hypothetical protein